MKVLTLTQPWASLVAIGAKKIETRSWYTKHRGPIAIHAAKNPPPDLFGIICFTKGMEQSFFRYGIGVGGWPSSDAARGYCMGMRGLILATADLVNCVPTENEGIARACWGNHEVAFGDFSPGRWAWILEDVHRLVMPIPAKGRLGLWEIGDALIEGAKG